MHKFILVIFCFFVSNLQAQTTQDFLLNKQWILKNDKILKSDKIVFTPYAKEKVTLNTMIWSFVADGTIEYDYQTSEDIEACLGVDFLDLDIDESNWKINNLNNNIIFSLKGGYASIEDFIYKAEYSVAVVFNEFEGTENLVFNKIRTLYFKDLNKSTRR